MRCQRFAKRTTITVLRIDKSRRETTTRIARQAFKLPGAKPVYDTLGYTAVALHAMDLIGIDIHKNEVHWHADCLIGLLLARLADRHARKLMRFLWKRK